MNMSSSTSIAPTQTTLQPPITTTTATASETVAAAAAANASTSTATKKKFGKNLTKIVQSQQQVKQVDTRSRNNNVTNRNGLLLLSTKKSISNSGTSISTAANAPAISNLVGFGSNGIGVTTISASGPSIPGEISGSGGTTSSSFDGTVTGLGIGRGVTNSGGGGLLSSLSNTPKETAPLDAWGVAAAAAAEKAAAITTATNSKLPTENVTNVSSLTKGFADRSMVTHQTSLSEERQVSTSNTVNGNANVSSSLQNQTTTLGSYSHGSDKSSEGKTISPALVVANLPSAAWDEYGGRGGGHSMPREAATTSSAKSKKIVHNMKTLVDPDKEYMTSKARERALELQKAEEQRLKEQRDRITARLKELSAQTSEASASVDVSNNASINSSATKKGETQLLTQNPAGLAAPLIHLTSYEDRDRGMSAQNAQPRMLFDPKSGSMVAVKSREEAQTTSNVSNKSGSKKLSSSKKSQQPQVNGKLLRNTSNGLASPTGKESAMGNNAKRKNSDSSDAVPPKVQLLKNSNPQIVDTGKIAKRLPGQTQSHPSTPPPLQAALPGFARARRSLPRTCGVLYKRYTNQGSISSKGNTVRSNADDSQSLFCADSCDGDLGYGAHSVPGGRMKNAEAYSKCKQQSTPLASSRLSRPSMSGAAIGKQPLSASSKGSHSTGGRTKSWDNQQHDIMQSSYLRNRYAATTVDTRGNKASNSAADASGLSMLYTGYNPSQRRDDDEKLSRTTYQLVTADDKLELIGMDDDEPKLRVTSNPFAPSRAALEAAATLRTKDSCDSDFDDDDNDDIDDEMDNIHSNKILLGVVGLHDDDNGDDNDDDYDDEEIDEHHHLTVNKAALNILDDDDDDHDLHHELMHQVNDDPLGLVDFGNIGNLLPKSTTSTSRLVQLEDIPLDPSLLNPSFASALTSDGNIGSSSVTGDDMKSSSAYNATSGHNIFGFGNHGPWGTTSGSMQSQTNSSSDWDILKLTGAVGGSSGIGSRKNSSVGLFGSDNAFGMPTGSLVSGMPSTTTWGSTFEGLNLNSSSLATAAESGGSNTNNAD